MEALNAITFFCLSAATGFIAAHCSEFILDLIARSSPQDVAGYLLNVAGYLIGRLSGSVSCISTATGCLIGYLSESLSDLLKDAGNLIGHLFESILDKLARSYHLSASILDFLIRTCPLKVAGYLIVHLCESILDLLANSSPTKVVLIYHFILSFILVAIYFARKAFTRRPGTLRWDHGFGSADEVCEYVKIAVFWWILLYNIAVVVEGFALGIHAFPFIMNWRQETCDDPEYLPLLMRLTGRIPPAPVD